ncbi:MAG: hypothetical protein JWM85_1018 [Acidimicrobiaceae bacterium]|nr:hypothetical protein [Acidimicrobiaceae bacterium]
MFSSSDDGGVMAAVYVLLALVLVVVLVGVFRRLSGGSRSITKYHKALDVLGELSERGQTEGSAAAPAPQPLPKQARSGLASPVSTHSPAPTRAPTPPPSTERPLIVFNDEAVPDQGARAEVPGKRLRPSAGRSPRDRRLVLIGLLLAVAGVATGVVLSDSSATRPLGTRPITRHGAPSSHEGSVGSGSTAQTSTSSTTTTLGISSSKTVLSSLTPDVASAGQSVTLYGSNFSSSNGVIIATFDGRAAPTRCPTEQKCVITVPPGLSGTVTVRLRTATGTSNGLSFRYVQ